MEQTWDDGRESPTPLRVPCTATGRMPTMVPDET